MVSECGRGSRASTYARAHSRQSEYPWCRSIRTAFSFPGSPCRGCFGSSSRSGLSCWSGYVLLADLVERLHWLTQRQLIDAVAAGQVTPGPVFTTAMFIGYLLAGPAGALVATAGIFLPAFVFVAASGPMLPRLRASPTARAFLECVNVASLALMAAVTAELGRAAIVDLPTALLGLMSAALLLRFKVNVTWLVLGGAAVGVGAHLLGLAR